VRAVSGLDARLHEAASLGFKHALVPASSLAEVANPPLETTGATTVSDALALVLD
jgi:predicted ATP-dependent serine protease